MKTITQKEPQYKERLGKLNNARSLLIHYLDMSEAKYNELIFELGCKLLDNFFENMDTKDGIKQKLLTDPSMEYWGWWKLQWNLEELNFWKANSWMVEESKQPKFFNYPISNTATFRSSWISEMNILTRCREMHERLHYHIIQIDPYF